MDLSATLTTSDGHSFAVVVRDLSAEGFRVDLGPEELLLGEQIRLQMSKHETYVAEVKWVAGREAGGLFLEAPGGNLAS